MSRGALAICPTVPLQHVPWSPCNKSFKFHHARAHKLGYTIYGLLLGIAIVSSWMRTFSLIDFESKKAVVGPSHAFSLQSQVKDQALKVTASKRINALVAAVLTAALELNYQFIQRR